MVAKAATVGLVILVVGLVVGFYGAYTPVSAQTPTTVSLISTSLKIAPNDYQSRNSQLAKGETVNYQISIQNQTIFQLTIMNQSQYYTFYGCAPFCRVAANITGVGPVTEQNLTSFVNVTVTPSSPVSASFTAPANGTYYFIFDNAVGTSYATYIGQNASGFTTGSFSLTASLTEATSAVNWNLVGAGVVLLIVGGAIATAMWGSGKPKRKTPMTTGTVPPVPPTTVPPAST